MAAINSATYGGGATQTSVTGNLIALTINGNKIGRAQNASSEIQYGTTAVYGIGSINPIEHVYTRYEGTLQLEQIMMIDNSFVDSHYAALGSDILSTGTVDVVVKNKDYSNKVIAAFIGCTPQNYSMSLRATALTQETMNMTYLTATLVDK
jgi:hypothetical protein